MIISLTCSTCSWYSDFFKIHQERKKEEVFKIQQEREKEKEVFKIQQERSSFASGGGKVEV